MRTRVPSWLAAAAMAGLAGCTSGPAGTGDLGGKATAAFRPYFVQVLCPADVEVQLVAAHSCGYLTVLQDRSDPAGPQVKVFVVKIIPPGRLLQDPVLSFGFDVGFGAEFGSNAPLAERTGRVAYLMDPRGTGHSQPSLACPQEGALTSAGWRAWSGDAGLLRRFLATVRACRDRLTSRGIDPAGYDLAAVAGDVRDLRQVLGIRQWNLISYGSYSRALLQTLRIDPGGVRAAVMDSPALSAVNVFSGLSMAMGWALGQLFAACQRDRACHHAVPDLRQDWSRALRRLSRHPVRATLPGSRSEVTIDAGKLILAVRAALGTSSSASIGWLPAAIASAAAGHVAWQLLGAIAGLPGVFEYGYQPGADYPPFILGAYLSAACRYRPPGTGPPSAPGQAAAPGTVPGTSAFAVLAKSPYLAACRAWGVPPSARLGRPVATSIPVLVLTGQFDAFSPTPAIRAGARSLARAWFVQIPWQVHNVLGGSGCALTIRNRWLDTPTRPPDTACLSSIRPPTFATPTR